MSDLVGLIANVSLALSFIVALVFGIAQVRVANRDRRERLALEQLRNFQSREFAELMQYIYISRRQMPKNNDELRALPINEQIMFVQLSQQMESLGLMVAEGLIDLQLVDRTLGSFVTIAWKKYETMFLSTRAADPYIGEYFQWLAGRIEENMRNSPRKPAYQTDAS